MRQNLTTDELSSMLHHRSALVLNGTSDHALVRLLAEGKIMRVLRGWYAMTEEVKSLWPEDRHLLKVIALAREHPSGVFSHVSAAALHRLPILGLREAPIHMTVDPTLRSKSTPAVRRHFEALPPKSLTAVDGIACTSLARTAVDIARSGSRVRAIALVDAAARKLSLPSPPEDGAVMNATGGTLFAELSMLRHVRGLVKARSVVALADSRAESPYESVSRLFLVEMGFDVVPQVEVRLPNGRVYRSDFELRGLDVFGEVDGKSKYLGDAIPDRQAAEQILYDEKRREEAIAGATGKRFVRWGPSELTSAHHFWEFLISRGVRPPHPP